MRFSQKTAFNKPNPHPQSAVIPPVRALRVRLVVCQAKMPPGAYGFRGVLFFIDKSWGLLYKIIRSGRSHEDFLFSGMPWLRASVEIKSSRLILFL